MSVYQEKQMAWGIANGGSTVGSAWAPGRRRAAARSRSAISTLAALTLLASLTSLLPNLAERLTPPADSSTAADTSFVDQLTAAPYNFVTRPDGSLAANNHLAGLTATLDDDQLALRHLDTKALVTLDTVAFGRTSGVTELADAAPSSTDLTATIAYGPIIEWLRNEPGALEQGWTVPERPAGTGRLALDLSVAGASVDVLSNVSARFSLSGGAGISYDGLKVHDAAGTPLAARFRATPDGLRILVADAAAKYPIVIDPTIASVETLFGTPNTQHDNFGQAIDIEGRWMAITALADRVNTAGGSQGSVYLYFDQSGSGDWQFVRNLSHPALGVNGNLGYSVAIEVEPEGITLAVGSAATWRVLIWTIPGDPLTTAVTANPVGPTVMSPTAYSGRQVSQWGSSIDLQDDLLVVGAPLASTAGIWIPDDADLDDLPEQFGERVGLVDVMRRSGEWGGAFTLEQRIDAPNGLNQTDVNQRDILQDFGAAVSLDGNLLAIGAPGDDGVQTQTGGTLASPTAPETSANLGAVHLYRYTGPVVGSDAWVKQAQIEGSPRRTNGTFGDALDLSSEGDLIVGEPVSTGGGGGGQVHLFDHVHDSQAGTDNWSLVSKINADDPTSAQNESTISFGFFGVSVVFSDDGRRILSGGWNYPVTGNGNVGAALVYTRPGTGPTDLPTFSQKISGIRTDRFFGRPVAADGDNFAIGASGTHQLTGLVSGAAYTYRVSGNQLVQTQALAPSGHRFDAAFGTRVARDGDYLAVIAPVDRRIRTDNIGRGAVHIFRKVNGAWTYEQVLNPEAGASISSTDSEWGASVDIWMRTDGSGNDTGVFVAIGAPSDNDIDRDGRGDDFDPEIVGKVGTVAVFGRPGPPGTNWGQFGAELWAGGHQQFSSRPGLFDAATLTVGGRFGEGLSFTADGTLLVGEPGAAGGAGQLHRYDRTGVIEAFSPSYSFRETVVGTSGTAFGETIATDGNAVYVAGNRAPQSTRISTFTDGDVNQALVPGQTFLTGLSTNEIAIDVLDGRIALGSQIDNEARIYRLPSGGDSPVLEATFTRPSFVGFGWSVAFNRGGSHKTLVVGAPLADPGGATDSGEATVYVAQPKADGSARWSEAATLAAPGVAADLFGFSVLNYPADGGAMVGAPGRDDHGPESGAMYTFPTAAIEPPPGPDAFVDVSTSGQVPVGADYIPVGGLPPSLLTDHAQSSGSIAAASIGGIDLSQPPSGTNVTASGLSTIPIDGLLDAPDESLRKLPLSSLALKAPKRWETLLAGSAFDGVPIQSLTLADVADVPAVRELTWGDLQLAASGLSTIGLSTIAIGELGLSTIDLGGSGSNIEQWCEALADTGFDPAQAGLDCNNPGSAANADVTLMALALAGADLSAIGLSTIGLSTIDLTGTGLSTIGLSTIDIAGTGLSTIGLSTIEIGATGLSTIGLSTIGLSTIPITPVVLADLGLSTIGLSTIGLSTIGLSTIDIAGSGLSTIGLSTIGLSTIGLSTIGLSTIPLDPVLAHATLAGVGLSTIGLSTIGLSTIDIEGSALADVSLDDLSAAQLEAVIDGDVATALAVAETVGDLHRLGLIDESATLGDLAGALGGIRLGDIADRIDGYSADDVRDGLDGLTLDDLDGFDNLTLGELPEIWPLLTLGDLGSALGKLRLADLVGIIDDGAGGKFDAADFRAALDEAFGTNGTLGEIGPDYGDLTLGELGQYGDATIGELLDATSDAGLDGLTLGDLLLALIARTQYPWEDLDFADILAQELDSADASVPVSVAFEAEAEDALPRDLRVTVELPAGSSVVPGSAALSVPVDADELKPEIVDGKLVWTFSSLPANAVYTLTFALEPTVRIGTAQVKATMTILEDGVSASDTAGLTVIEVLEPNDTPGNATTLPENTIVLSHVSTADDVDVFKFQISDPESRASVFLSNLDADLDIVLYGPKASSADIQEPSDRALVPVEDEGSSVVDGDEVQPLVDDDLAVPAALGDLAVIASSTHRGTRNEQIDTGSLNRAGTFYAVVSGYQGAANRAPYALRRKRFESSGLPACPTRNVTPGTVNGSLPASLPAGTDTVFLVNQSRMAGLYGAAQAANVRSGVDQLVSYLNAPAQDPLGVSAVVLPVDADAAVRAAYSAWDASPCRPETANAVVGSIVDVLDRYRDAGVSLKHVVVVGGDDAIPFARVPDKTAIANEKAYASTFGSARHALSAALSTGHVLTDDAYGDLDPYTFGDRMLFVSDAAVGRLVETPTEITDQLSDFIAANGMLEVGTGLVTGYDFLTDGADAVADELDPTYGSVDRSLISDTWTRGDLEAAISSMSPDVASINAHFDHMRALPGLGNSTADESDLFTAAAVRGALADKLASSVVFSMGCHSGYSASDLLTPSGLSLDFAQAIASQGGVFVGNTGYGYGDTELVALSERLMAGFAQRLDGALSVGEAFRYAKAEYAADLTAYGVYDEKAMMEATLYGLPFYRLDVPNPPPVPPLPAEPTVNPDPVAGVDTTTIEVTPVTEERTGEDGSTYYVGIGEGGEEQTTAIHDRPVQPRAEETFTAPNGSTAHDGLVVDLATTDHPGTAPHIYEPVVDDGQERTGVTPDVAFPTSPVRVNPVATPAGEAYTMTATTGYFRTTSDDGSGIQRLVDSMTVTPYFRPDADDDFVRPTFRFVDAVLANGSLTFTVDVVDDRGGPERVKRVYVLVLGDPASGTSTQWRGLDLVRSGSRWTGSLTTAAENIEYVLQAVDAAGNVAVTTNKQLNYRDREGVVDPPATSLEVDVDGDQGNNGWYVGPVTVTASGAPGLTYEVLGTTSERDYTGPVSLTDDGLHTVIVRSNDGQQVTRTIKLDTTGPVAILTRPQDGSALPEDGGTEAQFTCLDAGSGVTSCSGLIVRRTDFGNGPGTTSALASGENVTGIAGRHTVTVSTGADKAGNPASVASVSSTFVVVPAPIVTVTVPDIPAAGQPVEVKSTFTGRPEGGPYTVVYDWGDGTTTSCASNAAPAPGCSITLGGAGGTTKAQHTFSGSASARTVTVKVINRFGVAGVSSVTFNRTTSLAATPALVSITLTGGIKIATGQVSARLLNDDGNPLAGRTITFKSGNGTLLCNATTGTDGRASCPQITSTLAVLLSGYYKATFAGDQIYLGVSATAPLIKILF